MPPVIALATRTADEFEALAGTRYRRLAPRWILGGVVFIVGLMLIFSMIGGMSAFGSPTPDPNGNCPIGWAPGWMMDGSGKVTSTFCSRLGLP